MAGRKTKQSLARDVALWIGLDFSAHRLFHIPDEEEELQFLWLLLGSCFKISVVLSNERRHPIGSCRPLPLVSDVQMHSAKAGPGGKRVHWIAVARYL